MKYSFNYKYSNLGLASVVLFLNIIITTQDLAAQNKLIEEFEKRPVQIVLGENRPEKLPAPGLPIELNAKLLNTRDFRQPLRLLLVKDQNFQEILTNPGLPDSGETPRYSISIPAPLVELSYQFLLTLADGSIVTSPRQSIRRDCVPDITPALEQIGSEISGDARFKTLIEQNKTIENEISNLQLTIEDLKQVNTMLAK
jgi:hypothetical protein